MTNLRRLSFNALLAAMCAALGAVSLDFGAWKITFESLPVLVGALLFGPVDGMLIGGVGTLLYQLLRYGVTLTTPLWIAPYVLCGLLAGAYAKAKGFELNVRQTGFILLVCGLTVYALNTLANYLDSVIYGYYTPAYILGFLLPRLLICLVKAVAFTAALPPLLRAARQALKGGR